MVYRLLHNILVYVNILFILLLLSLTEKMYFMYLIETQHWCGHFSIRQEEINSWFLKT